MSAVDPGSSVGFGTVFQIRRTVPAVDPRPLVTFGPRSLAVGQFHHQIPGPRSASVPDPDPPDGFSTRSQIPAQLRCQIWDPLGRLQHQIPVPDPSARSWIRYHREPASFAAAAAQPRVPAPSHYQRPAASPSPAAGHHRRATRCRWSSPVPVACRQSVPVVRRWLAPVACRRLCSDAWYQLYATGCAPPVVCNAGWCRLCSDGQCQLHATGCVPPVVL